MPLFQNESKGETIHLKFRLQVHFHAKQSHFHFHKKGFALRLVLTQRYSVILTSENYSVFGKLHFLDTKTEGDKSKQMIKEESNNNETMLTMKFVFPLSPRQSCRSLVRVEFLYGTCLFCPRARA